MVALLKNGRKIKVICKVESLYLKKEDKVLFGEDFQYKTKQDIKFKKRKQNDISENELNLQSTLFWLSRR